MAYANVKFCFGKQLIITQPDLWLQFTDNKDRATVFHLHGSDEDIEALKQCSTNDRHFEVTISYPPTGGWWDRSRNEYTGIYGGSKRTYNVQLVNGVGILKSQSGDFYSYVQWSGNTNKMDVGQLVSDLKTIENPGAHLGEIIVGGSIGIASTAVFQAWFNVANTVFGASLCESNSKTNESGLVILPASPEELERSNNEARSRSRTGPF